MKKNLGLITVFLIGLLYLSTLEPGQVKDRPGNKGLDISVKTKYLQTPGAVRFDLNFGKFPLYFITNNGQVNEKAAFYAKTSKYTLWLTRQGLVFDGFKKVEVKPEQEEQTTGHRQQMTEKRIYREGKLARTVSRVIFLNANKNPEIVPIGETKLRVNYFIGNDKSKWHGDIPTSKAVLYKNLYKNVDLKVYGIEKQIQYDWLVKPGGNPGDIRFRYKNVNSTRLDKQGNLLVETDFGEFIHKCPMGYQKIANQRVKIIAAFKPINPGENIYGFVPGEYDKNCELIIDPVVLAYSTYLGGESWDWGRGIAVDSKGYAYVTGYTGSSDFPTSDLKQYPSDYDVFVTKIDTTEAGVSSLIYSTYLGGEYIDFGHEIAVDSNENVYVAGDTFSTGFPIVNQYQTDQPGSDAFLIKIDTRQSGSESLIYSTYLGGGEFDYGSGIAVDSSGNAYVTGSAGSTDFPTRDQYQSDQPGYDAFVTKIDTTQSGDASLVYSTYLGGSGGDGGAGIAVDSSGYTYVIGNTTSTDFPTLDQYQTDQPDDDVFVTKIDTTQAGIASLIYSTYLGGNGDDDGTSIAVDSNGYAYLTGYTDSTNFPTLGQYQADQASTDVYVTKIDTNQSGTSCLIFSTYLGGSGEELGAAIAVGSSGYVYLTGHTNSMDFPTRSQYQADQGSIDAFVTKLSTNQIGDSSLIYSTYLGGSYEDQGTGIAVDSSGAAYVSGFTESYDFPTMNPYQGPPGNPYRDAFVTKLIYGVPPFRSSPDFNGDGYGDVLWRYYGTGGYNAIWLIGTTGADAGAAVKSLSHLNMSKIKPGFMNFARQRKGSQENVWETFEKQEIVVIKDGFAGVKNGNRNSFVFPNLSRAMAASVTDPRDDPQGVDLLAVADLDWQISGTGDFNFDGKIDIVWSHTGDGRNCVWYMDGVTFSGYGALPQGSNLDWTLSGVEDFNLDGKPDLLWRNEVDGRNAVWYMDGTTLLSIGIMTAGANLDWKLCGTGDFNNDGKADLVWRNTSDGQNAVWYMDGAGLVSVGWLTSVEDQNWKLRGTGDFNNDGKTDLIWTYTTDGRNCIWYLDGVALTGVEFLTTVTDTTWEIEN
ncbi:MAG: SBBP repeat-containing protein [Candidatus Aminicenantes bacterium]|jgi:hypothetical protein